MAVSTREPAPQEQAVKPNDADLLMDAPPKVTNSKEKVVLDETVWMDEGAQN